MEVYKEAQEEMGNMKIREEEKGRNEDGEC